MKNNKHRLFGISGRIGSGKDETTRMLQFLLDNPNSSFIDYENSSQTEFSYVNKKFADKLKDVICILINCTREQLEDREFKETPIPGFERYKVIINTNCGERYFYFSSHTAIRKETLPGGKLCEIKFSVLATPEKITPRKLMQIFGTDAGRDLVSNDFWAKSLFSEYLPIKVENGFNRVVKNDSGFPIDYQYEVEFPKWVISDLRYPNDEGELIKRHHGLTIGVKRKFALRFPKYSHLENQMCPYEIPYTLNHEDPELYERLTFESEEISGDYSWCDYIIENNSTLEDLFNNVKRILNENSFR